MENITDYLDLSTLRGSGGGAPSGVQGQSLESRSTSRSKSGVRIYEVEQSVAFVATPVGLTSVLDRRQFLPVRCYANAVLATGTCLCPSEPVTSHSSAETAELIKLTFCTRIAASFRMSCPTPF